MEIVYDHDSNVRRGEPKISISREEYNYLLIPAKSRLKIVEKRYNKYLDIHDSGEATENEQNKMFESEDEMTSLKNFITFEAVVKRKFNK